tara:strand:+ start:35 stop:412 length:378 start_codon:yes stop_codon:yes gene_type:complete
MATRELSQLTDPIDLDDISRFRFAKVYEENVKVGNPTKSKWGNVRFFGMWARPDIPSSIHDRYHQVTAVDQYRLDKIAYKFYGAADMAWVIASANPTVIDPVEDIVAGRVLRIPATSVIFAEVLK